MDNVSATNIPSTTKIEPNLCRVIGPWLLLLFIVGDILGTGIYALTGQVAKQVGGVVWLPFLVAYVVALITAFSCMGEGDVSRITQFQTTVDRNIFWSVIAATTLAFFAMIGFEDSVNMVEECKNPTRIFPKILLAGLSITAVIYVLVSISAITLVPPAQLSEGETPLLKVVQAGAPHFPLGIFAFITMFAVANTALINMLMASRLVYGMSREQVLPPILGKIHATRRTPYIAIIFTTLLAFGLIIFVGEIPALSGTTALLLLGVFTIVNIAVLVLRRDPVDHKHFRAPTFLPVLGAISCAFFCRPMDWSRYFSVYNRRDPSDYWHWTLACDGDV